MESASTLESPVAVSAVSPLPPECLPNYEHIITEDDTPVDSIFCERQAQLLTEVLYCSWSGPGEGRSFVTMSDVGLFYNVRQPPVVPDFLLSLDVQLPDDAWPKENRSYFVWNYGKFPDLVLEIVSNTEGGEAEAKRRLYAKIGIPYYVILDPLDQLGGGVLVVLNLRQGKYVSVESTWLPDLNLGLRLWDGRYNGLDSRWLRWCDASGRVLPMGDERSLQEQQRADQEQQRADQEQQRADQEQQRAEAAVRRAEALATQLRSLGIDPAK